MSPHGTDVDQCPQFHRENTCSIGSRTRLETLTQQRRNVWCYRTRRVFRSFCIIETRITSGTGECRVRARHSENVKCFIAKLGNAMKDAILNVLNALSPAEGLVVRGQQPQFKRCLALCWVSSSNYFIPNSGPHCHNPFYISSVVPQWSVQNY